MQFSYKTIFSFLIFGLFLTACSGGFGAAEISSLSDSLANGGDSSASADRSGTVVRNVYVTSYGYDDNDDGSGNFGVSAISNPIIHEGATEDLGTFDRPSTFATDKSVATPGTKIYVPRLRKYFIMEDTCGACASDARSGLRHVDLYIGGNLIQGQPLFNCENALTASGDVVIFNPGAGWPVNSGMLYNPETQHCNTTQFPVP